MTSYYYEIKKERIALSGPSDAIDLVIIRKSQYNISFVFVQCVG